MRIEIRCFSSWLSYLSLLLLSACQKEPIPYQEANFTFSNNLCNAPCTVLFRNLSSNADSTVSFHWSFGDGRTLDTTMADVGHRYSSPGIYQVQLLARKGAILVSERTAFVTINGSGANFLPVADFDVRFDGCSGDCSMDFINRSVRATTFQWYIEGEAMTTDKDFNHYFESPGLYEVRLQATNRFGSDDLSRIVTVRCEQSAAITQVELQAFPFFKPNGQRWDANSCCPDIQIRAFDMDQNTLLAVGDIVYDVPAATPVLWVYIPPLFFQNKNRIRLEFWDYDGPDYELIGQTDFFIIDDNPQICGASVVSASGNNNSLRVSMELIWN